MSDFNLSVTVHTVCTVSSTSFFRGTVHNQIGLKNFRKELSAGKQENYYQTTIYYRVLKEKIICAGSRCAVHSTIFIVSGHFQESTADQMKLGLAQKIDFLRSITNQNFSLGFHSREQINFFSRNSFINAFT